MVQIIHVPNIFICYLTGSSKSVCMKVNLTSKQLLSDFPISGCGNINHLILLIYPIGC